MWRRYWMSFCRRPSGSGVRRRSVRVRVSSSLVVEDIQSQTQSWTPNGGNKSSRCVAAVNAASQGRARRREILAKAPRQPCR
jgi:hypothetical protein